MRNLVLCDGAFGFGEGTLAQDRGCRGGVGSAVFACFAIFFIWRVFYLGFLVLDLRAGDGGFFGLRKSRGKGGGVF